MSIQSDLLNLSLKEAREADGTGNNLINDSWGSAGETLIRLTHAAYADSVSAPYDRGNARTISNAMADLPDGTPNSFGTSQLFIFIGQFLDHDLDLVHDNAAAGSMETIVPLGDPAFPPGSVLDLHRSAVVSDTGENASPREHANQITSFIDASNVYGSSQAVTELLRDGAYLITNSIGGAPTANDIEDVHGVGSTAGMFMGDPAFAHIVGDVRGDENIALTSMHEIWLKEHNFQVDRLIDMNLGLTDEQLFQTARKIVEAEWQKVIYEEWLPELLGAPLPAYQGYDQTVDPTISNEFAGAAFRFGHTMLPTDFERLAEDGTVTDELGLFDAFFQPHKLDQNGGVAGLVRGLTANTTSEFDAKIIDDVRNLLFGPNSFRDLATLNIMRGRDQGIPTLNEFRADFNSNPPLTPYTSFSELTSNAALAAALSDAYGGDIDKVDLWVGVLAEDKVGAAQVGETLQAILIDQFSRLRDGDRFYYEHRLADTPELLQLIEDTSFSEIIKRTTGIEHLQEDVFKSYERMIGDEFANQLIGTNAKELMAGEDGNDMMRGGGGKDEMYGGQGNDVMYGDDGHDVMYGEDGNDFMLGGTGNDHADGGGGNDKIHLGYGFDYAQGGDGNDFIRGGAHGDIIGGGHGNDRIYGDSHNDELYGDEGNDYVNGGWGNDKIFGGSGLDKLFGGQQNDQVFGDEGHDRIFGGNGNDYLNGGGGKDKIFGQRGNDVIDGGEGNDHLFGAAGRDTFVMGDNMGIDKIHGFNANQDKLAVGAHFTTLNQVFDHAHQSGQSTIISFSANEKVVLLGVSIDDLDAGNFSFQPV